MNGQTIFVGALVLTLVAFLWLLVTNPALFFKMYKKQCDENEARGKRIGNAVKGAASIAERLLKRK